MKNLSFPFGGTNVRRIINKMTVWLTVFAVILWSVGLPALNLILPAQAATNITASTTGLINASPNSPIKASSAATAIARLQIFTDQAAQNLNAATINFSGTGFAVSDLAALATGNTSGVALYNDSGGNPGSAIAVNAPSWSGNNVTLTTAAPIALTQSATSTFYIVIKTSGTAASGDIIVATMPANSIIIESAPAGPLADFSANNLVVDATAPTIAKAEKAGPQAVDVTFSETVQTSAATATSTYTLSDGLTVMSANQQGPSTFRIMANNNIAAASTTITVSNAVLDTAGNANASTTAVTITAENRIKISEILVGASGAATKEFVELYNGGDTAVNLQTNGYKLHIRDASGNDANFNLTFATSTIPAFGYFLIASQQYSDIGLTPDATYDASGASLIDNGGAYISTSATAATNVIDMVGWGTQPSGGYEGTAATSTSAGQSLERKAFGSSTQTGMATGGADEGMGNSWDTGNNSFDFLIRTTQQPQNSTMTEQQNFSGYAGPAGSGPMIMHMPLNLASTGADLNILAQIGDPQTPLDQIVPQLLYMVGDGTPTNNLTSDYTQVAGSHQGNGYFKFTVPQATVDGSATNGLYYYFKVTTNGGTRYMSASPSADSGGVEATVAQNPFVVTCQSNAGWTKHSITGTVKDQSNTAISGALVFLEGTGYNTTTAGDGTFTLSNAKDSGYNLIIVKTGYYEGWFNNIFLNGANFDIGNFPIMTGTGGGASGDSTKPSVKWTGPNDGMFGMPPRQADFKIFIGFSKDMESSTINNTNVYLTIDGSTASSSSVTYDNNPADNAAAGLPQDNYLGIVGTPAGGFMPNTTYYLIMTGNVRDTSGNPLQGNRAQGGHVISFTTGGDFMSGGNIGGMGTSSGGFIFGGGDMMPPYVMGTMPFDGSMNVVPNTNININFSDPLASDSINTTNIKLYKISIVNNAESLTPVAAAVSLDTSQKIVTINPSDNLTAGKYKTAVSGAVKNAIGIFLGNPDIGQNISSFEAFRMDFEVGANTAADNTKPTILGTWPTNNDTNIGVNPGQLTVQFSESMDPASINATTITLKKGTTQVTGQVNYDMMSHSASFAPTVALTTDSAYTFTVVGSATATSTSAMDIVGNPLNANSVVSFTTASTGDTDAPKIMFANGDDFGIAITFSESMNSAKITDSTNWASSTLKYSNYVLKYGPPDTNWAATGTIISLANASFTYDATTNTVIIEKLGVDPSLFAGKDYYIDMSSAGVTDLSGNALAAVTTFQMPINSSAITMGMLGPMMGGGMTGGMMGPNMGNMGMMRAGAFPMSAMAGKTTIYFVDIPTSYAVASGTKIVLTFPQGFDISGAKKGVNSPVNADINEWNGGTVSFSANAESSGGASNDGVMVDTAARTVTITLSVATSTALGTPPTSDFLHLDLGGIVNSSIPRDFNTSGYTVDIKIMDANNVLKETVSAMPFFISEAGTNNLSVVITATGAGTVASTTTVFLGSPMTGPIEAVSTNFVSNIATSTFTNLPTGQYMIFTKPMTAIRSIYSPAARADSE
ncbi:Ig-like domain-containing protein [Candidatus Falkowbacteria bacterium]|nr:Ig-like domain-containing protein [Candidatus Falkowbacteria bacterium]